MGGLLPLEYREIASAVNRVLNPKDTVALQERDAALVTGQGSTEAWGDLGSSRRRKCEGEQGRLRNGVELKGRGERARIVVRGLFHASRACRPLRFRVGAAR